MPDRVNVVVVNRVAEEALELIRAVDARLNVIDVSDLTRPERKGDASRAPELDTVLADADIVYALKLPESLLERAPSLKWIQTISTGVDKILTPELAASGVTVTNMSGIHEVTIAEYVLMVMLMFVKQVPRSFYQQIEGRWKWYPVDVLDGKTIGIVGMGRIGREVARVARLLNMRVVATHRSAREDAAAENVDTIYTLDRLHDLLGASDFVVLALPLTTESVKLIGEPELRAMKPTARIINVSRGDIIDEPVLVRALEEGWIAGAGLDVFAQEPLSADSPLRHTEKVIFTPHVAGDLEQYDMMAARLFAENLRRYLDGRPLLNVVDKTRGY